jgi:transposase-like protein
VNPHATSTPSLGPSGRTARTTASDGAPGLIKAIEQCWPASDRQHCAVHRVRNLLAKLPETERERVRRAYWQALDDATNERAGMQRLEGVVDQLEYITHATNGIKFTQLERQHLKRIRYGGHEQAIPEEVTAA